MKKNRVIFTEVFNEKDLLPVWLSYYERFFDDIVILDHNGTDDSIREATLKHKFTVFKEERGDIEIPSGRKTYSEAAREVAEEWQKRLLVNYKWVLYTHADEFVIADPDKYKGLDDYIEKCKKEYIYCTGRAILHFPEEEDSIDLTKPILKQRKYWWKDNHSSDKPLLSRIPLHWSLGFHKLAKDNNQDLPKLADPDLYLIHLNQFDLDIFNIRSRVAFNMNWFNKGKEEKELIPEKWRVF